MTRATCVFCQFPVHQLDEGAAAVMSVPPFMSPARAGDWATTTTGVFCVFRDMDSGRHAVYAEAEPCRATQGGDTGGDEQASDSWCRRFVRPLDNNRYAVITVYVYVHDERMRTGDPDAAAPPVLTRQTEFAVCRDPDDVGGTEEFCDYTYVPEPGRPATEDAARDVCDAIDPAIFAWDGTPEVRHDQVA